MSANTGSNYAGSANAPVVRPGEDRIFSQAECEALLAQLRGFAKGGGATNASISSWWHGELRWGRNRVTLGSDRRNISITVGRSLGGLWAGEATTNQRDVVSLEATVRAAERAALARMGDGGMPSRALFEQPPVEPLPRPRTAIWSDATFTLPTEARGDLARQMIGPAEAKGMLSAGYLEVGATSTLARDRDGEYVYVRRTDAQCSTTVRDPEGTGSGWAGLSSYDWATIDPLALGQRALQKCLASRNPVALEPGRYTVILEPQAVADLIEPFLGGPFGRTNTELGADPFALARNQALRLWRTKLGLKVMDERITLSHDPADPALGIPPTRGMGPVTWIDRGVLTTLAYDPGYGVELLGERSDHQDQFPAYRMSGGTTSMDEMIATTKRGVLVTRFWGVVVIPNSPLVTGLTRDGLWLIENGKITKPVKNFRFVESPLFMLNQVEQLGVPVRVFRPGRPAIVPPIKARDFSFTALIDAV